MINIRYSSVVSLLLLIVGSSVDGFTSTPFGGLTRPLYSTQEDPTSTVLSLSDSKKDESPSTFREAEVLGLKLMQEQKYEEALKAFQTGMRLPGSKLDVIRTKSLSGPSPVGGSMGGFESKASASLDEFELQAANYNMACAYAQLGQLVESVNALEQAFINGFDNYTTVRSDPDLDPIKGTTQFDTLMQKYEPKSKGFNPFGLFGGRK